MLDQKLDLFDRLGRFLRKPAAEQRRSMLLRWLQHGPGIPVPMRVPEIGWWLARNDFCGRAMLDDSFEKSERRFVESVLRKGMTVLDIGAHHGLYTLLASRKVGPQGCVVAFEPSTRERNTLRRHLRLNRCKNVRVEDVALGREAGSGELYVVEGIQTGCNCLRPPNIAEPTTKIAVEICTLDQRLERLGIQQVDFVKIDAEGAELEVFIGARRLFERQPRPVILVEVHDTRTIAWGYRSREIVAFLRKRGYRCFVLSEHAALEPMPDDIGEFNENVVAFPEETCVPGLRLRPRLTTQISRRDSSASKFHTRSE
jgi:FkbM family methyltransferase